MAGTSSEHYLGAPVTTKEITTVHNEKYYAVSASMQGWRTTMEDAHNMLLKLPGDHTTPFFAVYDGHGGSTVSLYAANNLYKILPTLEAYKEKNYVKAIEQAFLILDEDLKNETTINAFSCGSTAIIIIIKDQKIFCGNAGDCRAIASFNQGMIPLSWDHRVDKPKEKKRILKAGGYVAQSRVNGVLAVSRGFGDFEFKLREDLDPREQMVTCCPEVNITVFDENLQFIIMACDGIWDSLSNAEVETIIKDGISEGIMPEKILQDLMDIILPDEGGHGIFGCDNMTLILIIFMEHIPPEYKYKLVKNVTIKSTKKVDKKIQVRSKSQKQRSPEKTSKTPELAQSPPVWHYNN